VTDAFLEPGAVKPITYGGRELEVKREKKDPSARVVIKGTTTMAGSCTTQLSMFHNLVNLFHVPIYDAVDMLAHNPARIVNLDKQNIGSLRVGNRADILLFDKELELQKTIVAGSVVFDRHRKTQASPVLLES